MITYIRLLFILAWLVLMHARYAEARQGPVVILDGFSKAPGFVGRKYPRYVSTEMGYQIYYEDASVRLSRVQTSPRIPCNKASRIEYDLPPLFSWGNWASVRREFKSPLNLKFYRGLELALRVEVPSAGARLRITLSDVTDGREPGGDEMWWFDFDSNLLRSETPEWIHIRIPFEGFVISHGAGARHNSGTFNVGRIIAYEINLISQAGKSANGVILVDWLRTYR